MNTEQPAAWEQVMGLSWIILEEETDRIQAKELKELQDLI
jgi:hypothetical protein